MLDAQIYIEVTTTSPTTGRPSRPVRALRTCWREDNSAILYKNIVAKLQTHPWYVAKGALTYSTSTSAEKRVCSHYTNMKSDQENFFEEGNTRCEGERK